MVETMPPAHIHTQHTKDKILTINTGQN